jgi:hypothetical protein
MNEAASMAGVGGQMAALARGRVQRPAAVLHSGRAAAIAGASLDACSLHGGSQVAAAARSRFGRPAAAHAARTRARRRLRHGRRLRRRVASTR